MRIHDNQRGMFNVLRSIINDEDTKVLIGSSNGDGYSILSVDAKNDHLWMLSELIRDTNRMTESEYAANRPIPSIEYKPRFSCEQHTLHDPDVLNYKDMIGTGRISLTIKAKVETIVYRTPIDVLAHDLWVFEGSEINKETYWKHQQLFDDAGVSFTPVNENTMIVFFPK